MDTEKDVQVLVFEAGQKTQQLQITIEDDGIPEMDETFLIILMDSDCCVQVDNNLTAQVVIVDNDRGSYSYIAISIVIYYACSLTWFSHTMADDLL